MFKCNSQFRLGLLDGIQDRQTRSHRDLDKLTRVKNARYIEGYKRGLVHPMANNNNPEKGNRK